LAFADIFEQTEEMWLPVFETGHQGDVLEFLVEVLLLTAATGHRHQAIVTK
jgi:hypothetical protein